MTTYNHEDYMLDVAKNLKDIAHTTQVPRFYTSVGIASMDGLLNNLSSVSYPCIIAERGPDKRLVDNVSDNRMYQPFFTFFVLYQTEPGNDVSIRQARDNAETVAEKIIGKMLYDSINELNGLELLDENSIRISGIGPMGDAAHGVMVSFTLRHAAKFFYDDDDWIKPTS